MNFHTDVVFAKVFEVFFKSHSTCCGITLKIKIYFWSREIARSMYSLNGGDDGSTRVGKFAWFPCYLACNESF